MITRYAVSHPLLKRSSVVAAVLQSLRVKQAADQGSTLTHLLNSWGEYLQSQPGGPDIVKNYQNGGPGSNAGEELYTSLMTALPGSVAQSGALGALLGGGLGAGSAWLSDDPSAKTKDRPSYLKRVLLGALLGGGVGASAGVLDTPRYAYNNSSAAGFIGKMNPLDYASGVPGVFSSIMVDNDKGTRNQLMRMFLPVWQRHVQQSGAPDILKQEVQKLTPAALPNELPHRP